MAMNRSGMFAACTSYYGVLNLQALVKVQMHKFEKHYLDSLIGVFSHERKTL
jgi:hypothetical protein